MSPNEYRTAAAFKAALEARVRTAAKTKGIPVDRQRQLIVFDRYLARLHEEFGDLLVLKGALALQARVPTGRGTKDLDALAKGDVERVLPKLRAAGQLDLGDSLTYTVELAPKHPEITGEGVVYGGRRYRVQAELAGKIYGHRFGVDIALGPLVYGEPELVPAPEDFLEFVGVPRTRYRIYPRETHLAEKLHAYTLPRTTENMRVKDLPDIALLATTGPFAAADLRAAFTAVFGHRKSHPLPMTFPDPPEGWPEPYAALGAENSLAWADLDAVTVAAKAFLDPVLGGEEGTWDPEGWIWAAHDEEGGEGE